jgi:hypothetical protein
MAVAKSDKPDAKQVFDVAKPGKTAPDTSTRPIIVGHRPQVKDPMVNPEAEATTEKEPELVHVNKVIAPLETEAKPDPAPETTTPKATEPSEKPAVSEAETAPPAETEPTNNVNAAAVNALADQALATKKTGLSDEEIARQQALIRMTEEKKYHVKIGQARRRRSNALLVLLILLALAAAGAAMAIDAGLIKSDTISLPFDFL